MNIKFSENDVSKLNCAYQSFHVCTIKGYEEIENQKIFIKNVLFFKCFSVDH